MTIEEVQKELERRARLAKTDIGQAVINACILVENTAKKSMKNTEINSSKVYKRRSVEHSPSVDFDYPAIDTGRLVQSITHDVTATDDGAVVGKVGSNVKYSRYLEYGTSNMQPRSWLRPSWAINREQINNLILKAVKGESVEISIGESD